MERETFSTFRRVMSEDTKATQRCFSLSTDCGKRNDVFLTGIVGRQLCAICTGELSRLLVGGVRRSCPCAALCARILLYRGLQSREWKRSRLFRDTRYRVSHSGPNVLRIVIPTTKTGCSNDTVHFFPLFFYLSIVRFSNKQLEWKINGKCEVTCEVSLHIR